MLQTILHILRKATHRIGGNLARLIFFYVCLFWYAVSGYLYFELPNNPSLNVWDAVWWALVTMTTVGYGDFFPVTFGGRFAVAVPAMVFGIGLLGFMLSEVAMKIVENRSKKRRGLAPMKARDHILILGYPNLEKLIYLIAELRSDKFTQDKKICLVDDDLDEIPAELEQMDVRFVHGNPITQNALLKAGVKDAAYALVLVERPRAEDADSRNLAAVLMLRKLNQDLYIITENMDPNWREQLEAAGSDSVVSINALGANLMVQELQDPGMQEFIHELTSNTVGQQVYFTKVPSNRIYSTVREWADERHILLLGVLRGRETILNPQPGLELVEGDRVISIADQRPSMD